MSDDEILYRAFWIKATKSKLLDMTKDLQSDDRVEDFDRAKGHLEIDTTETLRLLGDARRIIKEKMRQDDLKAQNVVNGLLLLIDRIEKAYKNEN